MNGHISFLLILFHFYSRQRYKLRCESLWYIKNSKLWKFERKTTQKIGKRWWCSVECHILNRTITDYIHINFRTIDCSMKIKTIRIPFHCLRDQKEIHMHHTLQIRKVWINSCRNRLEIWWKFDVQPQVSRMFKSYTRQLIDWIWNCGIRRTKPKYYMDERFEWAHSNQWQGAVSKMGHHFGRFNTKRHRTLYVQSL